MHASELAKDRFALRRDADQDAAPIARVRLTSDKTVAVEAVDEADRAVVPNLEPLREGADRWRGAARQAFQRQEQLMLLGVKTVSAGSALAEGQKPTNLITELCERPVIRTARGRHGY